jgi:hypothetical protein
MRDLLFSSGIGGCMRRRHVPGDLLRASLAMAPQVAPQPLNGYLCATIWDWEQERTAKGARDPISSYSMKFCVLSPPTTSSDQTVFLFNGIQPSATNPNKAVLQPVLQWGNQDDPGGGQFWSVASWYVRGQPGALDVSARTKAVRVDPGTDLVATISLTDNSDGVFSYLCEFSGIAGSALAVGLPTELVRVTAALECYRVAGDLELPASPSTSFRDITIDIKSNNRASPNWQVKNLAPVGSHIAATLVSHAGIADEVDITYR